MCRAPGGALECARRLPLSLRAAAADSLPMAAPGALDRISPGTTALRGDDGGIDNVICVGIHRGIQALRPSSVSAAWAIARI